MTAGLDTDLPWAVNVSIRYPDVPLLERAGRARQDGFTAIESWWPFASAGPSDAELDAFVTSVTDAGVELVASSSLQVVYQHLVTLFSRLCLFSSSGRIRPPRQRAAKAIVQAVICLI